MQQRRFLAGLPRRYEPVVRSRLDYGVTEKLGITYTYDYEVTYASSGVREVLRHALPAGQAGPADRVPAGLQRPGEQRPRRHRQPPHRRARASRSGWPTNPPSGVDTRRNTIFFVNWYGRSDFKFHVYTKTDEPDPDTGYNFGVERDSRKMIAWGGTTADDEENGLGSTRRVWFHDLSAGPESWTGQLERRRPRPRRRRRRGLPDAADLGVHAAAATAAPAALAGDLGKITRYVGAQPAVHHLAALPGGAAHGRAAAHRSTSTATRTRAGPGVDASGAVHQAAACCWTSCASCAGATGFNYDNQDLPFTGEAEQCYVLLAGRRVLLSRRLGYPPFANLFLQNALNLERTQDDQGRVDYELPIFNYAVDRGASAPRRSASPTTTTSTAPSRTCSSSSHRRSSRPGTA